MVFMEPFLSRGLFCNLTDSSTALFSFSWIVRSWYIFFYYIRESILEILPFLCLLPDRNSTSPVQKASAITHSGADILGSQGRVRRTTELLTGRAVCRLIRFLSMRSLAWGITLGYSLRNRGHVSPPVVQLLPLAHTISCSLW